MTRLCIAFVSLIVALFAVPQTGRSQAPAGVQPPPPAGHMKDPRFAPIQQIELSCGSCHRLNAAVFKVTDVSVLSLRNEYKLWETSDLHKQAYKALSTPLGEQISKNLYRGDAKAAAKKADCLVCHATDGAPGAPLSAEIPDRFFCEMGVNCQACHGPSNEWDATHWKVEQWRKLTAPEKEKTGLVDLRHPRRRAEKCVSCHVGSKAENKFVTHEMYAAGHPPLPPFELATFSRDEPRHWLPPSEFPIIRDLDPTVAWERYGYRKGENEAARLAAVGAVVALRESVNLLGFTADPAKPAERLDFAHFNCAACHHDLRLPAARQANGYPGVPGRPVPTTWPVWAVEAVLRHAGQGQGGEVRKKFEAGYGALRQEFDRVPFGDRAAVVKQAEEVRKACDDLLAALDSTEFDAAAADALVRELAAAAGAKPLGRRDYLDADGAGHLARAAAAVRHPAKVAADGKPPESAPAFTDGPFKLLAETIGLTARDAYLNTKLLQDDGTFGKRVKRAADYEANPADVRNALRVLEKPSRETR